VKDESGSSKEDILRIFFRELSYEEEKPEGKGEAVRNRSRIDSLSVPAILTNTIDTSIDSVSMPQVSLASLLNGIINYSATAPSGWIG
jgi:hypothetical protein